MPVIVLLIKPFVWWYSRCCRRCRWSRDLLKVLTICLITPPFPLPVKSSWQRFSARCQESTEVTRVPIFRQFQALTTLCTSHEFENSFFQPEYASNVFRPNYTGGFCNCNNRWPFCIHVWVKLGQLNISDYREVIVLRKSSFSLCFPSTQIHKVGIFKLRFRDGLVWTEATAWPKKWRFSKTS